jgi:hypothetical protein
MLDSLIENFSSVVGGYIPSLLGAFAVLIVGWVIALAVSALVRAALRRTTIDNRLASWIFGEDKAMTVDVEVWTGRIVFALLMLLVLVGFFQILHLTLIAEPLNALMNQLFEFLPRLLAAAGLLFVAWLIGTVLRRIVSMALEAANLDERLGEQVGAEEAGKVSLTKSFSDAVFWLVLLLFLPAVLGALALDGILAPIQGMIDKILGFLPNLFAAGLILFVGWFMARIIRRIVTSLLAAAGADRLSEKAGLAGATGGQKLSGVLGLIAYVLILVPVLIASLNALGLDAITRPASNMLNKLLEAIPNIFAAALVLILAYAVGRIISGLVKNVLAGIGFNGILVHLKLAKEPAEGDRAPSAVVGFLILVAIMIFASIEAAGLLGFDVLAELISQFTIFAGHVILGLIIFGIGLYLAGLASRTVLASGSRQAGLLARAAWISIVLLSAAIGLRHMNLANETINLAFGLLLGAVAVAVALAFGLGGQEIARNQLREWMEALKSDKRAGPGGGGGG